MRPEAGFTLLEILAALAIVATGIAATMKVVSENARVTDTLETRSLSTWIAANRLAELHVARTWPAPGEATGSAQMGGREWYYQERFSATPDPDIQRVDIQVYRDAARKDETGRLTGYLAKP